MTSLQQDTINSLTLTTATLIKSFARGDLGEYVRTLTTIESIVKTTRERLSRRTVLDLDTCEDEEL